MPFSHRDLWSTAHVNMQLASGPMSEGKTFMYFLAITGFDWLQFTAFRLSRPPEPIPTWGYFDAWFAFALTIAALVYLFLCNGGTRGAHFLHRYFPLSVVVGWKIVAASFVVLPAVKASLREASPSMIGWSLSVALASMNLVMFLRIGHHLKGLSREDWGQKDHQLNSKRRSVPAGSSTHCGTASRAEARFDGVFDDGQASVRVMGRRRWSRPARTSWSWTASSRT
jgi:hypothetical protein